MSRPPSRVDDHRHVYTAAAQMMWLQQGTYYWRGTSWPEGRRAAWTALEQALARPADTAVAALAGFDPAHHLLSRRGPEGRPITFGEAAADWRRRLADDPGVTPAPKADDAYGVAPGTGVVMTASWHSWLLGSVFAELDARMAPGRPAVNVAPVGRPLAELLHMLAARLRAPLAGRAVEPVPTSAVPVPLEGSAPMESVSPADYEQLCARARAAAESLPSPARLTAERDFTVSGPSTDAAARLLRLLEGRRSPAWEESPEHADPAHDVVRGGVETWSLTAEAENLGPAFDAMPVPRPPHGHEVLADYEDPVDPTGRERLVLMSQQIALLLAEVLDEFAARVTPAQRIGRLLFDAYPVCAFLRGFDARLRLL